MRYGNFVEDITHSDAFRSLWKGLAVGPPTVHVELSSGSGPPNRVDLLAMIRDSEGVLRTVLPVELKSTFLQAMLYDGSGYRHPARRRQADDETHRRPFFCAFTAANLDTLRDR